MEGKIVHRGVTREGMDIIIRYPESSDAQAMCDYINALSEERTFIRFQGEKVTLESETDYLNKQINNIKDNKTVELFIIGNGRILGITAVDMKDKTESHEGVLGISIVKEIRGEGIGKKFMELILHEAESNLEQLKLITLGVFGDNELALDLYPKFGFVEYGRLPGGSHHNGRYVDHVYMYKKVR